MITLNVECKKALFQKSVEQLIEHTHQLAYIIRHAKRKQKTENISSDIVGPEKCVWRNEPFPHTHSATISSYSTRDAKYY